MPYGFNDDMSKFDLTDIQQQIDSKISLGDIKIIQGTIASVPAQTSRTRDYSAAQLQALGISDIDDYVIISCMRKNNDSESWVTGCGNHDDYGYANPYIVEIGSEKIVPLQIQAYNISVEAADITYRIVLLKVA